MKIKLETGVIFNQCLSFFHQNMILLKDMNMTFFALIQVSPVVSLLLQKSIHPPAPGSHLFIPLSLTFMN